MEANSGSIRHEKDQKLRAGVQERREAVVCMLLEPPDSPGSCILHVISVPT